MRSLLPSTVSSRFTRTPIPLSSRYHHDHPQDQKEQIRAQMMSRNDPTAPQPIPDKEERKEQVAEGWGDVCAWAGALGSRGGVSGSWGGLYWYGGAQGAGS